MDTDSYATFLKEEHEFIPDYEPDDDDINIDDDVQILDNFPKDPTPQDTIPMEMPSAASDPFTTPDHKVKMAVLEAVAEHDATIIRKPNKRKPIVPPVDELDSIINDRFEQIHNRTEDYPDISPAPYSVKRNLAHKLQHKQQFRPASAHSRLGYKPLQLNTNDQFSHNHQSQPICIEVRLFTRSSLSYFSSNTFIGEFIIPYLPGCIRIPATYTSMMVKADNLISQTKPYSEISRLYDMILTDPAYSYLSYDSQYTVKGDNIPRRFNKYIPEIRTNEVGQLIIIMIVTVDLTPKYDIVDISTISQRSPDENIPPSPVPMSSRLGPPVQRMFYAHKIYRAKPKLPSSSTPKATPERKSTPKRQSSKPEQKSILKNKQPLKPKSLQFSD